MLCYAKRKEKERKTQHLLLFIPLFRFRFSIPANPNGKKGKLEIMSYMYVCNVCIYGTRVLARTYLTYSLNPVLRLPIQPTFFPHARKGKTMEKETRLPAFFSTFAEKMRPI